MRKLVSKKLTPALFFSFFVFTSIAQTSPGTKIYTTDIENFWTAYDSALSVKDSVQQKQFIQTLYLDQGTPGLQDFIKARDFSPGRFVRSFLKHPKFWASIRPHTLQIEAYKPDLEVVMDRYRKIDPAFQQPDIYFAISPLITGGTTSKRRILIGSEIAAADSTVDASDVNVFFQGVFRNNQNVVYMIAHETMHTQQIGLDAPDSTPTDLLVQCVAEGAADFMAEKVLQRPITSTYILYGRTVEKELWEKFKKDMTGMEMKNWLYNGSTAPDGHGDLGYFMGYSICQSYYQQAADKKQAIHDIFSLNYADKNMIHQFFDKSGYARKWD
jgi:Predicted Zn-dependent protease (DUF2268)